MTVKVAIDLALDRLFTYEVPEALVDRIQVGQLVDVPFGYRPARAFVIEVGEDRPEGVRLKSVSAIVDEVPFFSPKILDLVRQIAVYTASPLECVLRAALPAAVLRKNARPRELMFIEPALAPAPVELTKRQQWLYDQIVRLGGGWMTQLCRELSTTPATIRELGLKGLVTVAVRAKRRDPLARHRVLPSAPLPLNDEQHRALEAIGADDARPLLLFGVTGSGKTEVYLQAIAKELAAGRGAIVMVPEISLTPQTVQRFASRFGDRVAVLHSALSDGERYDEWHRIRSGAARVVVGPRSAVWAPVANLGLIVVDEEHETSYKQEETPRYHARDVAVLRGRLEGARVLLGSATPSLESWRNVRLGKYAMVEMRNRAGAGRMPAIHCVEMRDGAIFSRELVDAIHVRLQRHEQTILFLNRRGYSRSMTCGDCGDVVTCPDCDVPYTYHRADSCLRCHVCGRWIPLPEKCPRCGAASYSYVGIGTQRVEAALRACFREARILRMDADSTSRKNSHDDILGAFRRLEADILIGTQMITKGLDFPNVTLVGVLNADSSLNMPDPRAGERTYQLLSQVAGRAGRAELSGEVFIQSHDPSVPVIGFAARGDFAAFAEEEMKARESTWFPPCCHLAVIALRSRDLKTVGAWADLYAKSLMRYAAKSERRMEVSEAVPSPVAKADGWYRWMVMIRAEAVREILSSWRWILSARPAPKELVVTIDVDAFSIV